MRGTDPWMFWFAILQNLIAGGLMGYWWSRVRHIRREERKIEAMRATVERNLWSSEENLARSARFLREIGALTGHDDDPTPITH